MLFFNLQQYLLIKLLKVTEFWLAQPDNHIRFFSLLHVLRSEAIYGVRTHLSVFLPYFKAEKFSTSCLLPWMFSLFQRDVYFFKKNLLPVEKILLE